MADIPTSSPSNENEISLVDIVKILLRRRRLFLATWLIIFLLGMGFIWLKPASYQLQQTLKLASYAIDAKVNYVQEAQDVAGQINNIYVPAFVDQYNQQHPSASLNVKNLHYSVKNVDIAGNNQNNAVMPGYVILQMAGGKNAADFFADINQFVLKEVQDNEQMSLKSLRDARESQQKILAAQIAVLSDFSKQYPVLQKNVAKQQLNHSEWLVNEVTNKWNIVDISKQTVELNQNLSKLNQTLATLSPSSLEGGIKILPEEQLDNSVIVLLSLFLGLITAFFAVMIAQFVESFKAGQPS